MRKIRFTLVAASIVLVASALGVRMHLTAALQDCVGKPYGFPGCPTRPVASSSASASTTCGNAILEAGEQCDQGRFNGKADCSETCITLSCGDGVLSRDIDEECEPEKEEVYVLDKNGNLTTEVRFAQGASACGWFCKPPICDKKGVCTGGCTLQYISACTATGAVAASVTGSGATASSAKTSSVSPLATPPPGPAACGNGVAEAGEECDDGNTVQNDGCSTACKRARCGDGTVQTGEECDDGNALNEDACTNACRLPRCGDGIRQGREECDDNDRNADSTPNACRTNCLSPRCGDGTVDTGEQCDAGAKNSDAAPSTCRTTCRLGSCGDGVQDATEECDDGNQSDADACLRTCRRPVCGDGIVQASEQCDEGKKNSDTVPDACRRTCKAPRCGDRVTDRGEECDGGANCAGACVKQSLPARSAGGKSSTGVGTISRPPESGAPPGSSAADAPTIAVPVIIGGGLLFAALLGFLFRNVILSLLRRCCRKTKDIDDVPLDQIEMPWHKW